MSKIGISELRQHLKKQSSEKLIEEMITLYKKFPAVKEYYQAKLSSDGTPVLLAKYKTIITNEFFPSRGFGKLRLSNIRKAFSDFKKVSGSLEGEVDLMLHFVEEGARFITSYGDIAENFYGSMESMYEKAAQIVIENHLKDMFYDRFEDLVVDTSDTGYGFGDTIRYLFEKYFPKKTLKNT